MTRRTRRADPERRRRRDGGRDRLVAAGRRGRWRSCAGVTAAAPRESHAPGSARPPSRDVRDRNRIRDRRSSIERARIAARAADDKKGDDIVVLDVGEIMGIVDSVRHRAARPTPGSVRAIVDEVEEQLPCSPAVKPRAVEGLDDMSWVLLDYGDLVVHVFLAETREFYGLERLWAERAVSWNDAARQSRPIRRACAISRIVRRASQLA